MNVRRFALTVTIAGTTSLAAGATPAPAATKVTCATKGSVLAVSPSARVFVVKSGATRRVYGCASTKKLRKLGLAGGEGIDTSVLAVNGPRVGFVTTSCGDTGCQQSVLVRNLKTGKLVSSALSAPGDVDQKVTDIVLSRTGSVGWISEQRPGGGAANARFVSARSPGTFVGIPVVPVATGLDIVPGTLALAGAVMYWTQGVPKAVPIG